MEKKTINVESPVSISGIIIIPVVESRLNYRSGKSNISLFCYEEPVSVVVLSHGMKKAFRINGEQVSLEELTAKIPKLKEMLEKV